MRLNFFQSLGNLKLGLSVLIYKTSMKNKRRTVDFKMSRKLPPLLLSPFIRAARWTLLASGVVYGMFKLHNYRIQESKIRPLREKTIKEKYEKIKEQELFETISEFKGILKEIGVTEFPEGWENFLSRVMERTLPPANISPLIKGLRWSLLIAGILYGSSRYSMLSKREKKRLEEFERTRPEREAKIKLEKDRISREQIEDLNKQLGI